MSIISVEIVIFVACCYVASATSRFATIWDTMKVSLPRAGEVDVKTMHRSSAELRIIAMIDRGVDHYARSSADNNGEDNDSILYPTTCGCSDFVTATCRTVPAPCSCSASTATVRCYRTRSPSTPCSSCTTTTMATCSQAHDPQTIPPCCCCCTGCCSWIPLTRSGPSCVCTTVAPYTRQRPSRVWSVSCHTLPSTTTTTVCHKIMPPTYNRNRWPPITVDSEWSDDGSAPTLVTCQIRTTTSTAKSCRR